MAQPTLYPPFDGWKILGLDLNPKARLSAHSLCALGFEGHPPEFFGSVASDRVLSPLPVPVADETDESPFELFERSEFVLPMRVELVFQMSKHLFGGRVVQTVPPPAQSLRIPIFPSLSFRRFYWY